MTNLTQLADLLTPQGRVGLRVALAGDASRGLAIALHGRNGAPDQPQMVGLTRTLLSMGFSVLVPALRNSAPNTEAGTADGEAAAFTMQGHLDDASAILDFLGRGGAQTLGLPTGPLLLAGHSMGSYAALSLAATRGPGAVGAVLAVSPVVSGAAILAARFAMGPAAVAALEAEVPGAIAEYSRHDLAPLAAEIRQPVGMVVAARDGLTRPSDVERLRCCLPRALPLETVPGNNHCPSGLAYETALTGVLSRIARPWPPVVPDENAQDALTTTRALMRPR
ncbi:MAG: hypothetical protein AAF675_16560 [Pseudomonadota bacterium]